MIEFPEEKFVPRGLFFFKVSGKFQRCIWRLRLTSEAHSKRIVDPSGARNRVVMFIRASSTKPSSIILDAGEVLIVNDGLGHMDGWFEKGFGGKGSQERVRVSQSYLAQLFNLDKRALGESPFPV